MNLGQRITDRPLIESIPKGSSYLVETGDGSGSRQVKHETLVKEVEKALPIGDMEELGELEKLEVAKDEQEDPTPKGQFTLVKAILKLLGIATSVFGGTDGIKPGTAGIVPPPQPNDDGKVLGANGEWVSPVSGGSDIDAEKVKFADGKTAEEKLGMIDGATDDLNCENDRMVAKMTAVKKLNDGLKFPDGTQFYADMQDGKPGFNTDPARGADTFVPFFSKCSLLAHLYNGAGYTTDKDCIVVAIGISSQSSSGATNNATVSVSGGELTQLSSRISNLTTHYCAVVIYSLKVTGERATVTAITGASPQAIIIG